MRRYRGVHQFHSGTSMGDAVTQQMLQVQSELVSMGFKSEIFGEHIDQNLSNQIRPISEYSGSNNELLFLHHSMGNNAFDDIVALPNDIVVVYHNITPEHFFDHPIVRSYARLGREQLAALAPRARSSLADSNYNRREMLALGFKRVEVLPVRTEFSYFLRPPASNEWRSTDWLYVGRLVRNKGQHDLVRAFAVYATAFDDHARLVLIGDLSDTAYATFVRTEASRLGIADRVVLLGKISEPQLRSAFAGAGVFVSLSEHEGFGVPILEAMAAQLPVVALGATAVPETMGGAGILLRTSDPAVVASVVQTLLTDPGLRERLIQRQLRRIQQAEEFDTRAVLERVIATASGANRPLEVQLQGPFETSYGLAIMNRKLASALNQVPGHALSIFATEGPGDYKPRTEDLDEVPEAAKLYERSARVPYPDVVIRQMWPPRVIDSPGAITCEYFGWEESRVPQSMVDDFNRHLNGIGVTSEFVAGVLRDCGVDVPVRVVGNGVETPDSSATITAPELVRLRSFRFLHISSAFPRKGVDVLLNAYFSEFDGTEDVCLILKTFPNPHNEVGSLLKHLRGQHPNPPDVRWIDRDLSDRELHALYGLASCYVHPARGEGFGLPVAEAMAAGVPVISVQYSGLADFVSPQTAITIPFRVEPARTHLEVPGSTWAEPDQARLAIGMRQLVKDPDTEGVRARATAARELIATRFSWDAAAERWVSFLRELEEAAENVSVAMATTWNSRCGVAEYAGYLIQNSKESVEFQVFANKGVQILDSASEAGVIRCWSNRWSPDLDELSDALELSTADVLHIQFNFGFFELQRLAAVIDRQLEHRGVVVTFHRTQDIEIDGQMVSLSQMRPTLERVDCLIVHQERDATFLAATGLSDNVRVVHQGTATPPTVRSAEVRAAAGLGSRPVLGTFGFLLPHKGTLELVRVVDTLRSEFPDICLLALCARHPDASPGYEDLVRAEIECRGLQQNVVLVTDYLPDETARAILRAADAVVLPYSPTQESSSAALRFVLPVERPIIATDLPIFEDCREALFAVDPKDPPALEDAIRRVLLDPELQRDLSERAATAARRFRWSRIAADHREIYAAARSAFRRRQERTLSSVPATRSM